ncbi:maltase A3 [Stomoxys calcitrans]|uniref:maltase A3 n=1 Tax=Stomoxys calcitrans TaxID=35570 RepID=UPI0027E2CC1A|nr:maltase A3 [Stomoxys calcitrans]
MRVLSIVCIFLSFLGSTTILAVELKWWQTASFYQIYPRSFKDSDGDGIGDLKGITQELPYLKELGITATWLSPIFTSPMADFGYDVANLTDIDPLFGTMEDFEDLIENAKAIGIKIILDFVPNHTSDECEWFIKSAARDPQYKDFYVWHPGRMVNGVRQPPTNWISLFRGSMWTWHAGRYEYYLHQFHAKQPDLNYRNPKVMEAMKDVFRFWLRRGASGFRVDAVPNVFEIAPDAYGNYPDEPRNPSVNDPEDYMYHEHIYTVNQPETIDMVYQFRQVLEEMDAELGGDERIIMTEAYSPLDILMQYYGNATHEGAQIPFNFELISYLKNESNAYHYDQLINNWLNHMPKGKTANWVMGNHDNSRFPSRLGRDRIDIINMMLLTLPGCSITYMGEEIGMTDVWISWNDTVDPQACQSNPQEYERLTRDPPRTPFQWNDEKFAGFTEGSSTWLPVGENYKMVNVKRERDITRSHLNVYKQLQRLRKEPVFQQGESEIRALNENVLAIKRSLSGHPSYVVVLNINDNVEFLNLNAAFSGLTHQMEYVVVTDRSSIYAGALTYSDSVLLMPKEAIILKTVT